MYVAQFFPVLVGNVITLYVHMWLKWKGSKNFMHYDKFRIIQRSAWNMTIGDVYFSWRIKEIPGWKRYGI